MSRRYPHTATAALYPAATCPARAPGAVGVTVATGDGHMELAREAVARWTRYTGLPGMILQAAPGCGYWAKYDLAALLPGRQVCYFDADLWMCREPDMDALWPEDENWDVQAVQDCGINRPTDFPCIDCTTFELDRLRYFNTGWFTMDTRLPGARQWLDLARQLTLEVAGGLRRKPTDDTEQTILNIAAQQMPELRVQLLGSEWNFLKIGHVHGTVTLPRRVYNAHAAGYALPEKGPVLEAMCRTFEID